MPKMNRKTTINLSPEEVQQVLVERFTNELPRGAEIHVTFNVRSRIEGYGMGEHEVVALESVDVVAES